MINTTTGYHIKNALVNAFPVLFSPSFEFNTFGALVAIGVNTLNNNTQQQKGFTNAVKNGEIY